MHKRGHRSVAITTVAWLICFEHCWRLACMKERNWGAHLAFVDVGATCTAAPQHHMHMESTKEKKRRANIC
eukprot:1159499-Pelagomonas_calceolata.AAC.4